MLWNNDFWLWFDDDDGVLSLGGHSFAIVEVYLGMLKDFSSMVWFLLFYYHL